MFRDQRGSPTSTVCTLFKLQNSQYQNLSEINFHHTSWRVHILYTNTQHNVRRGGVTVYCGVPMFQTWNYALITVEKTYKSLSRKFLSLLVSVLIPKTKNPKKAISFGASIWSDWLDSCNVCLWCQHPVDNNYNVWLEKGRQGRR